MKKYNINPNNVEMPEFGNLNKNINNKNKEFVNNYKNKLKKKLNHILFFQ